MSYDRISPTDWLRKLVDGKFATVSSAKKSIAKTQWPKREKIKARELADKSFSNPGSVTLADWDVPLEHKRSRIITLQQSIRACREALDLVSVAKRLYPETDLGQGRDIAEDIMPQLLTTLRNEVRSSLLPAIRTDVTVPGG